MNFEVKGDYTVQDIFQLLYQNGAGEDPKSSIRIWNYDQLFLGQENLSKLQAIGQGGYGSVYVINIEGLDYAIKIMKQKKGQTQQQLINNFYNECKSFLQVNHNRVLRIVGVATKTIEEGNFVFCHYTNYQQKGNLYNLIKNNQLFPDSPPGSPQRFYKKIRLLSQIAEGVHAIHNVGLIHRDIKSYNILLDENDTPKIADLGLANDFDYSATLNARGTPQ